jgi:MFS family permease
VGLAFAVNFASVGTGFYLFNVLMKPICAQYHWSRTEANLALVLATVASSLVSILYGTMLLRTGPRTLMAPGALAAGISFIMLGHADRLWTFYLLYIVLYLGNGAMAGIVANTAVNNWFVRKRGTALGLATMGQSASGAVMPLIGLWLLDKVGLQGTFFWIGLGLAALAPIAWLLARRRPEDFRLLPDGDDPPGGRELEERTPRRPRALGSIHENGVVVWANGTGGYWLPRQVIRTGAFWKIGCAYGLAMIGVVGVMSQLSPHFTDIGYPPRQAAIMMSATAFFGALGKFVWGYWCDRFDSKKVLALLFVIYAGGLALIFLPHTRPALFGFIVVFGFAMGGIMSTFPIIIAELFGRESYAAVARFASLFLLMQIAGYYLAGQSFDLTGAYYSAYALYTALALLASLFILTLERPRMGPPLHPTGDPGETAS